MLDVDERRVDVLDRPPAGVDPSEPAAGELVEPFERGVVRAQQGDRPGPFELVLQHAGLQARGGDQRDIEIAARLGVLDHPQTEAPGDHHRSQQHQAQGGPAPAPELRLPHAGSIGR